MTSFRSLRLRDARMAARLGIGLALLALGCTSVQVQVEARPGSDLARYATYLQAPPPATSSDLPGYNEAIGDRIQAEIARELDAKGYRAAPAEDADLRVSFQVDGQPRTRVVNAGDPDVDYYVEQSYVEGSMVIEVEHAGTSEALWQGRGQTRLFTSGALIRSDVEKAAVDAVKAILAKLPERPQG